MDPASSLKRTHRRYFLAAIAFLAPVYALYGVNFIGWRNSPDYGWRPMYDSGPNVVAEVFAAGEAAGLRVGDAIQSINGKGYSTFDELYFKVRDDRLEATNAYTVIRDGKPVEIRITSHGMGLATVFRRSGYPLAMGLVYVLIGALVFLMKPQAVESWLFFVMTSSWGLEIGLSAPSDLIRPLWFYDIRLFIDALMPAPMIHLALMFPKRRALLVKRPWLWAVPYAVCGVLFVLCEATSTAYWNVPPVLDLLNYVVLLSSIIFYIGTTVWSLLKDPSVVIRLQSRVIFVGILLGLLLPIGDLVLRFTAGRYIFPDPSIWLPALLTAFPLSIGYTIVKHDLFAIDVIVRRTYGYILSTGSVVGAYALLITLLNLVFRGSDISRSPLFSIGFALGAVFFFRPLHERFQRFVDRMFYRQRYDYRQTIKAISEAMTSVLDPKEIQRMLVGSVVSEMFLENGVLALRAPGEFSYRIEYTQGVEEGTAGREIPDDLPLLRHLKGRTAPIFRYDVELDPGLEGDRKSLLETFRAFASEVMVPLRYKDQLRGIVSLGRKKTGKMFTHEDVDLLKTVASQGAIALENAHLFEENLEKGRMEEELKIAHDIQVSMLPEKAPEIKGLRLAAKSIPAREVGGDFYDFVTMDGEGSGSRVAVVVGDVSGKAVSGALVMAASRSLFRVLTESQASVGEVMCRMNSRLHKDVKKGMFVAALYALLDSRDGMLTVANAGQTSPVLCPADGGPPELIENEGERFPLGIVADCSYEEIRVPLRTGDTVVLYTDGVVEAVNGDGEMFGFERFLASVAAGRGLSADMLLERLLEDVSAFVGGVEQHDDITLVVAKMAGNGESAEMRI